MPLQVEQVEIDGVVYECRELSMGAIMPLLDKPNVGLELLKQSVFVDGEVFGDGVDEIGFKTGRVLIQTVNKLNGLVEDTEKS